jgi:hypothetical protein
LSSFVKSKVEEGRKKISYRLQSARGVDPTAPATRKLKWVGEEGRAGIVLERRDRSSWMASLVPASEGRRREELEGLGCAALLEKFFG